MDLVVSISFFLWQTLYAGGDIAERIVLEAKSAHRVAYFDVEIMDEPHEYARGFMSRIYLGHGRGMLFLYEDERILYFWMKNTLIPLDILYFDADRVLVDMKKSALPCLKDPCPLYPSIRPAMMALELPAGTAQALGLEIGDIFFPARSF